RRGLPGFFPAPESYHQGRTCHVMSPLATALHLPFVTLRFPALKLLLQPVSHTSPPEQQRDRTIPSRSLSIEQSVRKMNTFSALPPPNTTTPPSSQSISLCTS